MTTKHLLRQELHAIVDLVPPMRFSVETLPQARELFAGQAVSFVPEEFGAIRESVLVPGVDGPDVPCLLYRPMDQTDTTAGYVHIHGGGYVIGSAAMSEENNLNLVQQLGIVVLSVDYRLAPDAPVPGPLNDCYAALAWLHGQAATLGVDPNRIGVGGESAGGGLAAALAIHARDQGQYAVCHQHLTYPMLDDRTGSDSHPGDPLVGEFVWTRESNRFGWGCYLGDAEPAAPSVPARVADCAGLAPAWIFTVGLDLFRDENIAYAQRLMAAGVAVELDVLPGACHGFQMVPGTEVGRLYTERHRTALARGLGLSDSVALE